MKGYYWLVLIRTTDKHYLMAVQSEDDPKKHVVHGFESELAAVRYFEESSERAVLRGGTWATAACLFSIEFDPVVVKAPRDHKEFVAWVKKLDPLDGKVFTLRGEAGWMLGFEIRNAEVIDGLRATGTRPRIGGNVLTGG